MGDRSVTSLISSAHYYGLGRRGVWLVEPVCLWPPCHSIECFQLSCTWKVGRGEAFLACFSHSACCRGELNPVVSMFCLIRHPDLGIGPRGGNRHHRAASR